VNEPALLVPELTAQWESRLQAIARGEEDPQRFHQEIRGWIGELVGRLLQGGRVHVPESGQRGGKGKRAKSKKSRQSKNTSGRESHTGAKSTPVDSPSQSSWRTHARSPSSSTRRKPSSSKTTQGRQVSSNTNIDQIIGQRCPRCKEGEMIQGQRGWGCNRWRQGCQFVLWFEHDGVQVPEPEAARLCARGKSRLFHQHEGTKYRLVLSTEGHLTWEAGKSRQRTGLRKKRSQTKRRSSSR